MSHRPPEQLSRAQLYDRIVRRSLQLIRDCDQAIADTLSYNDTPQMQDQTPFDVEDLRVTRAKVLRTLNQFFRENPSRPHP